MKSLKQPCIKKKKIIHNSISRDRGKTGALIELSVPLEVAAGITNYEIVREHFLKDLAQDPQHPFFVDHKGTPLKLKGYQNHNIYEEMCKAMGVASLTFTENRRGAASKMRAQNLTGNTAMGHSAQTQEQTYDIYKVQQGALNKLVAFSGRSEKGIVANFFNLSPNKLASS